MDDKTTAQPVLPKPDCGTSAVQMPYPPISTNMGKPASPEAPSYLLTASGMIVSFAKGHMSYEEYREKLDAWWENNKEAWQEHDLLRLFRLICLTN
jgi:hypothetical protein